MVVSLGHQKAYAGTRTSTSQVCWPLGHFLRPLALLYQVWSFFLFSLESVPFVLLPSLFRCFPMENLGTLPPLTLDSDVIRTFVYVRDQYKKIFSLMYNNPCFLSINWIVLLVKTYWHNITPILGLQWWDSCQTQVVKDDFTSKLCRKCCPFLQSSLRLRGVSDIVVLILDLIFWLATHLHWILSSWQVVSWVAGEKARVKRLATWLLQTSNTSVKDCGSLVSKLAMALPTFLQFFPKGVAEEALPTFL